MTGAVVKRRHRKTKKVIGYSVVLSLGYDENGKRRLEWHSGFKTYKEAQAARTELVAKINRGEHVSRADDQRLGVYLEGPGGWLANMKDKVEPGTHEWYAQLIRSHIKPALGDRTLQELRPQHIRRFISDAYESGRRDGKRGANGKGGLSPRTVIGLLRLLRSALKQAVEDGLIPRNPADVVKPPKRIKPELNVLDVEQTMKLLKAAQGTPLFLPTLLAVGTGLRRGEVLGLSWDAVDLDAAELVVRRTLRRTKAGGLSLKDPKTETSRRRVGVPDVVVDALWKHRAEQEKAREAAGDAWEGKGDLVFTQANGRPLDPSRFSRAFAALVRRTKLPRVRFHDLRHGHATLLLAAGENPKAVSERLGHYSAAFTLSTYAHVLPGQDRAMTQRLAERLQAAGVSGEAAD